MTDTTRTRLQQALSVYADWRMAKIFILGILSGFPWVLIGSMITLWLQEEGFSRTGIGLFGLVFAVYAINLLWAPIVDSVRIPVLSGWLGQRRSWIVAMQAVIAAGVIALSTLHPAHDLFMISAVALIIATASATQDVAIDATRIELIGRMEPRSVGAGSAMATSGWWAGYGLGGSLALLTAQILQSRGIENYWQGTYLVMLGVIVASVATLLRFVDEPEALDREAGQSEDLRRAREVVATRIKGFKGSARVGRFVARVYSIYTMPVARFLRSHGARVGVIILATIFLFKIGEAFLGRMSLVFYKEVGFSKTDIALYQKGLGTFSVCVFSILGSLINARYGLFRGMVLSGIAMASTNLLFALLAMHPARWLFTVAVVTDQFTTAISTVAFVAFISQLCDRTYTAAQYAAFASLGNLSRTTLSASSGAMVDALNGNWSLFFVITTLMVVPSLVLLLLVRKDLQPLMEGQTTRIL